VNGIRFCIILLTILALPGLGWGVTINEIRIDQPGADTNEYFELTGRAGESLHGLSYIVIGDSGANGGVIEAVINLTGHSISASGFFVAGEASFALGTADLTTGLNFENGDNVTHLLVSGFSGANGNDLDAGDDGILDATPWTSIIDSLALIETIGSGDPVYSAVQAGPDGGFVPGHAFRSPDATGSWQIGPFSIIAGRDTPGFANISEPASLALFGLGLVCLASFRRHRSANPG